MDWRPWATASSSPAPWAISSTGSAWGKWWILSSLLGRYHWPAFNVADSLVCVGAALLAWVIITEENPADASILLNFGAIKIFTYGFLLAVAFLTAIFVGGREARRLGIPPAKFFDLCFYIILAALVGSRLLYVILEINTFIAHPLKIFAIWEGGLVFHGGVILALLVAFFYMHRHGLDWRRTLDALGVGLPLGQFFGRLGCFMAGCCYGSPADLPWSVVFTNPDSLCPVRGAPASGPTL